MKRKTKKYALVSDFTVSKKNGISFFRVLRDEEHFAEELMTKYIKDLRELLNAKLDKFAHEYNVPQKDIKRIKDLVHELEKVAEINAEIMK